MDTVHGDLLQAIELNSPSAENASFNGASFDWPVLLRQHSIFASGLAAQFL